MKSALVIAVLAVAIASRSDAAPCAHDGSAKAAPVFYYSDNDAVLDGLNTALNLGLEPATFPDKDIADHPNVCMQGHFTAADEAWTLYGSDEDQPPRWARGPKGAGLTVYLAAVPPADQAHDWAEAQRKHRTHEDLIKFKSMMFALVATEGANRLVYGFYDEIPDNVRLTEAMKAVIEGRRPAVASYNVEQHEDDLYRTFAPLTPLVLATKGKTATINLPKEDGAAFHPLPDGSALAVTSGLVCPPTAGFLQRSSLLIGGEPSGADEVGCRYVNEMARMEIIATRASALPPGVSVSLMLAPAAYKAIGKPRELPAPPSYLGSDPQAEFYLMRDGAREGVVFFSRGQWLYDVFVVYGGGSEAAISSAIGAVVAPNEVQ